MYSDVMDRWAGSRTVWNQHAYSVTHVEGDGTVPRGRDMERNWEAPGLNNFRQNVQGDLARNAGPDVTVRGAGVGDACDETDPNLELFAEVCSRGRLGVGAGISVAFYDGEPDAGGERVCTAVTSTALRPGECERVSCTWSGVPTDEPLDVHVRADSDEALAECVEENNRGTIDGARCPPPLD
ncbi:MAG: hypothetical protein ACOCUS_04725 [Polyangiales bacterium]